MIKSKPRQLHQAPIRPEQRKFAKSSSDEDDGVFNPNTLETNTDVHNAEKRFRKKRRRRGLQLMLHPMHDSCSDIGESDMEFSMTKESESLHEMLSCFVSKLDSSIFQESLVGDQTDTSTCEDSSQRSSDKGISNVFIEKNLESFEDQFPFSRDDTIVELRSLRSCLRQQVKETTRPKASSTEKASHVVRAVNFATVEIREYCLELGDNPSCTSGPPLTIGWDYKTQKSTSVKLFDETRMFVRRDFRSLRLSREEREARLLSHGVTMESQKSDAQATNSTDESVNDPQKSRRKVIMMSSSRNVQSLSATDEPRKRHSLIPSFSIVKIRRR